MLERGIQYSVSDFIALKEKVKAEMLRRCYEGSLAAYGGADYDFAVTPKNGSQILAEHVNKIIVPINQINDSGFTVQNIGDIAKAMNTLDELITAYSEVPLNGEDHFCNASCTGLCSTSCYGTCGGTCDDSCSSTCSGTCRNNCAGGCYRGCLTSCTGGCGGTCVESCASSCYDTCKNGCYAFCSNDCAGGCSGSCSGSCSGGCSLTCTSTCKGSAINSTV